MGRAPTGMPFGDSFMGMGPGGCCVAGAPTGCLLCTIVHVMHEPFSVLSFLLISMITDKACTGGCGIEIVGAKPQGAPACKCKACGGGYSPGRWWRHNERRPLRLSHLLLLLLLLLGRGAHVAGWGGLCRLQLRLRLSWGRAVLSGR